MTLGENKVCGLTHPEEAAKAYQAGAVFGGLIFVEQSKRAVNIEQARLTMSGAPLNYVGVFQNHPVTLVAETANQLQLHAVQLHGNEEADYIAQLRKQLNESIEIWKAYGVTDQAPTLLTQDVDRHLFDAQVCQQSGGTGTTFDWALLDDPSHIMLAGGLNPDNAQKAASLGCLGLDLNSGVEESPGKKDLTKLQQAFAAIRNY